MDREGLGPSPVALPPLRLGLGPLLGGLDTRSQSDPLDDSAVAAAAAIAHRGEREHELRRARLNAEVCPPGSRDSLARSVEGESATIATAATADDDHEACERALMSRIAAEGRIDAWRRLAADVADAPRTLGTSLLHMASLTPGARHGSGIGIESLSVLRATTSASEVEHELEELAGSLGLGPLGSNRSDRYAACSRHFDAAHATTALPTARLEACCAQDIAAAKAQLDRNGTAAAAERDDSRDHDGEESDTVVRRSGWLRYVRVVPSEGKEQIELRAWLARQPAHDSLTRLNLSLARDENLQALRQHVAGLSREVASVLSPPDPPIAEALEALHLLRLLSIRRSVSELLQCHNWCRAVQRRLACEDGLLRARVSHAASVSEDYSPLVPAAAWEAGLCGYWSSEAVRSRMHDIIEPLPDDDAALQEAPDSGGEPCSIRRWDGRPLLYEAAEHDLERTLHEVERRAAALIALDRPGCGSVSDGRADGKYALCVASAVDAAGLLCEILNNTVVFERCKRHALCAHLALMRKCSIPAHAAAANQRIANLLALRPACAPPEEAGSVRLSEGLHWQLGHGATVQRDALLLEGQLLWRILRSICSVTREESGSWPAGEISALPALIDTTASVLMNLAAMPGSPRAPAMCVRHAVLVFADELASDLHAATSNRSTEALHAAHASLELPAAAAVLEAVHKSHATCRGSHQQRVGRAMKICSLLASLRAETDATVRIARLHARQLQVVHGAREPVVSDPAAHADRAWVPLPGEQSSVPVLAAADPSLCAVRPRDVSWWQGALTDASELCLAVRLQGLHRAALEVTTAHNQVAIDAVLAHVTGSAASVYRHPGTQAAETSLPVEAHGILLPEVVDATKNLLPQLCIWPHKLVRPAAERLARALEASMKSRSAARSAEARRALKLDLLNTYCVDIQEALVNPALRAAWAELSRALALQARHLASPTGPLQVEPLGLMSDAATEVESIFNDGGQLSSLSQLSSLATPLSALRKSCPLPGQLREALATGGAACSRLLQLLPLLHVRTFLVHPGERVDAVLFPPSSALPFSVSQVECVGEGAVAEELRQLLSSVQSELPSGTGGVVAAAMAAGAAGSAPVEAESFAAESASPVVEALSDRLQAWLLQLQLAIQRCLVVVGKARACAASARSAVTRCGADTLDGADCEERRVAEDVSLLASALASLLSLSPGSNRGGLDACAEATLPPGCTIGGALDGSFVRLPPSAPLTRARLRDGGRDATCGAPSLDAAAAIESAVGSAGAYLALLSEPTLSHLRAAHAQVGGSLLLLSSSCESSRPAATAALKRLSPAMEAAAHTGDVEGKHGWWMSVNEPQDVAGQLLEWALGKDSPDNNLEAKRKWIFDTHWEDGPSFPPQRRPEQRSGEAPAWAQARASSTLTCTTPAGFLVQAEAARLELQALNARASLRNLVCARCPPLDDARFDAMFEARVLTPARALAALPVGAAVAVGAPLMRLSAAVALALRWLRQEEEECQERGREASEGATQWPGSLSAERAIGNGDCRSDEWPAEVRALADAALLKSGLATDPDVLHRLRVGMQSGATPALPSREASVSGSGPASNDDEIVALVREAFGAGSPWVQSGGGKALRLAMDHAMRAVQHEGAPWAWPRRDVLAGERPPPLVIEPPFVAPRAQHVPEQLLSRLLDAGEPADLQRLEPFLDVVALRDLRSMDDAALRGRGAERRERAAFEACLDAAARRTAAARDDCAKLSNDADEAIRVAAVERRLKMQHEADRLQEALVNAEASAHSLEGRVRARLATEFRAAVAERTSQRLIAQGRHEEEQLEQRAAFDRAAFNARREAAVRLVESSSVPVEARRREFGAMHDEERLQELVDENWRLKILLARLQLSDDLRRVREEHAAEEAEAERRVAARAEEEVAERQAATERATLRSTHRLAETESALERSKQELAALQQKLARIGRANLALGRSKAPAETTSQAYGHTARSLRRSFEALDGLTASLDATPRRPTRAVAASPPDSPRTREPRRCQVQRAHRQSLSPRAGGAPRMPPVSERPAPGAGAAGSGGSPRRFVRSERRRAVTLRGVPALAETAP